MVFVRSVEEHIAATPERVFSFLSDIRMHPEWSANPLTVEHVSGPITGHGAVYTSIVTEAMPGRSGPIKGVVTVIESHAPELFVYECVDDAGRFQWMFECTRWNDTTVLRHTVERVSGPWYVRMFQPLVWRLVGVKQARDGLAKLRRIAERPPLTLPSGTRPRSIELPTESTTST